MEFTFEMVDSGYEASDPFPYFYEYELTVTSWDPAVLYVNDYHLQWPIKYGGYLEIYAPDNWAIADQGLYGVGFESNPGSEITNVSGSLRGWIIKAKTPELVGGDAYLTKDGEQKGLTTLVTLPAPEPTTMSILGIGALIAIRKRKK